MVTQHKHRHIKCVLFRKMHSKNRIFLFSPIGEKSFRRSSRSTVRWLTIWTIEIHATTLIFCRVNDSNSLQSLKLQCFCSFNSFPKIYGHRSQKNLFCFLEDELNQRHFWGHYFGSSKKFDQFFFFFFNDFEWDYLKHLSSNFLSDLIWIRRMKKIGFDRNKDVIGERKNTLNGKHSEL